MATYTGLETKIMNNTDPPSLKSSKIQKLMNIYILGIILVQFVMCFVIALGSWVWNARMSGKYQYFVKQRYSNFLEAVLTFFTLWILLSSMIPISLIISLDVVKSFQAYFIEKDIDLYDDEQQRYAKVVTSSLNEELGQIENIFSDKTGTLTCNVMKFKYCVIASSFFGEEEHVKDSSGTRTEPEKKTPANQKFFDKKLDELIRGQPGQNINI